MGSLSAWLRAGASRLSSRRDCQDLSSLSLCQRRGLGSQGVCSCLPSGSLFAVLTDCRNALLASCLCSHGACCGGALSHPMLLPLPPGFPAAVSLPAMETPLGAGVDGSLGSQLLGASVSPGLSSALWCVIHAVQRVYLCTRVYACMCAHVCGCVHARVPGAENGHVSVLCPCTEEPFLYGMRALQITKIPISNFCT